MDIRKQLIILILVLLCAPVSAQKKEKLITLKFTNIPLSEAMPKVEKQSGYTFFYESQQIDIKQKVSLNVKNETINKTIAALLKGTNVKFEIDATHIILYTGKNNKAISGQPQNISGTVIVVNRLSEQMSWWKEPVLVSLQILTENTQSTHRQGVISKSPISVM